MLLILNPGKGWHGDRRPSLALADNIILKSIQSIGRQHCAVSVDVGGHGLAGKRRTSYKIFLKFGGSAASSGLAYTVLF